MKRLVFLLGLFCFVGFVSGAISFDSDGKWETSFVGCEEEEQPDFTYDGIDICDGLVWAGLWTIDGLKSSIDADANNPDGAGGLGARFWKGSGDVNRCTATIAVNFPSPQKELWVRWYERYENGFEWHNSIDIKSLYFKSDYSSPYIGYQYGGYRMYSAYVSPTLRSIDDGGWDNIYVGGVSDGSWHYFEVYMKYDTDDTDGIGRIWVDGELVAEETGMNWGTINPFPGWDRFEFLSNQKDPGLERPYYVDFDDLVIYNTLPPNVDSEGNAFIGVLDSVPVVATCFDGIQNQDEAGTDCGGACSACIVVENCSDGIQNQDETDVDCGGVCPACVVVEDCDDGAIDFFCGCKNITTNTEQTFSSGYCYNGFWHNSSWKDFVLFEDDFESDPSDWECKDDPFDTYPWNDLTNWDGLWMACGYNDGFGSEWRMGDGLDSSNAIYSYKKRYIVYEGTADAGTNDSFLVDNEANFGGEEPEHTTDLSLVCYEDSLDDCSINVGSVVSPTTLYFILDSKTRILSGDDFTIYGIPNNYRTQSDKWFYGENLTDEIYHSWCMKVPDESLYDKKITTGYKFWRYLLRENGHLSPPVTYLNVAGETFSSGHIFLDSPVAGHLTLINVDEFNDNSWHCHELNMKINSFGNSDGYVRYWFDGDLRANYSDISFSLTIDDLNFHRFGVGVGNQGDTPWYQEEWAGIGFDNIIVSRERIGYSGDAVYHFEEEVAYHAADTSEDGSVSAVELRAYIDLWLVGFVSIGDVLGAIGVWRG